MLEDAVRDVGGKSRLAAADRRGAAPRCSCFRFVARGFGLWRRCRVFPFSSGAGDAFSVLRRLSDLERCIAPTRVVGQGLPFEIGGREGGDGSQVE